MKLVKRSPNAGYLDSWLWLPKRFVHEAQIQSAFTYDGPRGVVRAWVEEAHHYKVPRNYLSSERLAKLRFPVLDARFTDFPRVQFSSNVVLDLKNPQLNVQHESVDVLCETFDGILCLRCGIGKSPISLHAAAQMSEPILIMVDDKGLTAQWRREIAWALGIPENEVGRCYASKFDWEHNITVATLQTLASKVASRTLPSEMIHHFGTVIVDEVHVAAAPYFNTAIPPFHGRRWGLSATPYRNDGYDTFLQITMGKIVYTYLMPELKPSVIFRRLPTIVNYSDPKVYKATHTVTGDLHFVMLYGYLVTLQSRLNQIEKDIRRLLSKGRKVIVLSHSVAMVKELGQRFESDGGGITYGEVGPAEHARVIKECNPVIAIMKRGHKALDKADLDTLVLADPFTKLETMQQSMGRILRDMSGKQAPTIVIYEDYLVPELAAMCGKLRRMFNHWPAHMGGRIPHTTSEV